MKTSCTISEPQIIQSILDQASYGTLALCQDNTPYCVPINFVPYESEIYFHGSTKGKKMDIIQANSKASFSAVEEYSVIPSYFRSDKNDACPATHLYQSVFIEGEIVLVEDYDQKVQALEALMQKYQPEGQYIPLSHAMYEKIINITQIFKLKPKTTTGKFKLGQNFNKAQYERVKEHLQKRGTKKDLQTLKLIEEVRA